MADGEWRMRSGDRRETHYPLPVRPSVVTDILPI
jgi:hypothetical protein